MSDQDKALRILLVNVSRPRALPEPSVRVRWPLKYSGAFDVQEPRRQVDLPRSGRELVDVRHDGVALVLQLLPILAVDESPRSGVVLRHTLGLLVDSPGDVSVSNDRRRHFILCENFRSGRSSSEP